MPAKQVDFLLAGYRDPDTDAFLSGGKVKTYLDGTSTLSALWTDRDKNNQAANPVILDAYGRAEVYGDNTYKFEIYDSDDTLIETITGLQYGSGEGTTTSSLTAPFDDFTQPSSSTEMIYFLDPDGSARNFDPDSVATFADGFQVQVFNKGSYTITFDSSGIAIDILAGDNATFVYDSTGSTWRSIYAVNADTLDTYHANELIKQSYFFATM